MLSTPNPSSATAAQRFSLIIRGLLGSVGARATQNLLTGGYPGVGMARLPWPMAELIGARFRRAGRLFSALAERVRLGTARIFPNRASPSRRPENDARPGDQPASGQPASEQPASGQPAPDSPDPAAGEKLPRGFGDVLGLLHWEAAQCADQLRQLLSDAEMVALLQSAPGFARIVRPLCRMLAVVPPPGLFARPPRRPRRRTPRADIAPAPSPRAACPKRARAFGGGQDRAGAWSRPRPMAWEARLEARLAGAAQKTS